MAAAIQSSRDSIARLRGIAGRLLDRQDIDAAWFAASLAVYEAGAGEGVTLDRAFGLTPEPGREGWWTSERRARRDDLLREMAHRFYPDSRRQAADIVTRLVRFASGARRWLPGTVEELAYLLTRDGRAPSLRTAQRALAAGRCQMQPPVAGTGPGVSPTHEAPGRAADAIVNT